MKPLIDGDILRYEIGYAAETGWRAITEDPEAIPPWDYVEEMLHQRITSICAAVGATEAPTIYLSRGKSFRDAIAVTKPYKGTRKEAKPWHFSNLTAFLIAGGAEVVEGIEADDAMAIEHVANPATIICSRDKDLRQVPGWFYSWELGKQPSFGPVEIDPVGSLKFENGKLTGTGLAFFYAQVLMGDPVDNVPGLEGCGPVNAYKILSYYDEPRHWLEAVCELYSNKYERNAYGFHLTEQGQLLWMVRRYNPDGSPQLWHVGLEE